MWLPMGNRQKRNGKLILILFKAAILFVALLSCFVTLTYGAPASPHGTIFHQPDGTPTPMLYLNGDEYDAWLSDERGYLVIQDEQGWYVYAKDVDYDDDNDNSYSSSSINNNNNNNNDFDGGNYRPKVTSVGARVGYVNPKKLGLKPKSHNLYASVSDRSEIELSEYERAHRMLVREPEMSLCTAEGSATNPCYLKQLGLLVKFADHTNRDLPSPEEIDVLFNHNGPTSHGAASTGSIADAYRSNSFDTFVLDTHVTPWQEISFTELYASQSQRGFNLAQTRECWKAAMVQYEATSTSDHGLHMFDADGDGYIDGLAIVHSGVPAEVPQDDCETGAKYYERIWSHAVPKSSNNQFLAGTTLDIKVGRFYVVSAVNGSCPPDGAGRKWDAGRIAVPVHEAGHFLGLPDLYGKPGFDNGIGNFGFMGNMYGWDKSQNWPGLMNAYCRYLLQWVNVVEIAYTQEITIIASCDSDVVYKVSHGMATDNEGNEEFFLLENRHNCGYDLKLMHPRRSEKNRMGLAVWYVDHTNLLGDGPNGKPFVRYDSNRPGDGSDSSWPGVHNRVSLVQGDGQFDLEKGANRGDEHDLFRYYPDASAAPSGYEMIAYKIDDNGVTLNGGGGTLPFPSTQSIATGSLTPSGITIEALTPPGYEMTVKVTLKDDSGNVITESAPEQKPPGDNAHNNGIDGTQSGGSLNVGSPQSGGSGGGGGGGDGYQGLDGATPTNPPTDPPTDPTMSPVQPTPAPIQPTPAPVQPTPPPTEPPVESVGSSFTCDNGDLDIEFRGYGNDPGSAKIRKCKFIIPRDPTEICDLDDLITGKKIYEVCQNECSVFTGCGLTPSPVAPTVAPVAPTMAPVAPTMAPIDPTVAPVTPAPVSAPTDSPVEPTLPPVEPTIPPTDPPIQPTPAPIQPTLPPTDPPIQPTPAPIQPTPPPTDPPVESVGGSFTCDNGDLDIEFRGYGNNPSSAKIRKCKFIIPRDPTEICDLDDLISGKKIYEVCQIECSVFTNCNGAFGTSSFTMSLPGETPTETPQTTATEIPQTTTTETPQTTATEIPQTTTTETPQTTATEIPQTTATEIPQTTATEIPQTTPTETPQTTPTEIPQTTPTESPQTTPTETPQTTPTETPQGTTGPPSSDVPSGSPTKMPVAAVQKFFTCDNGDLDIEFKGFGDDPTAILVRKCNFVTSVEPLDVCNLDDLMRPGNMIYDTCQVECEAVTGCI